MKTLLTFYQVQWIDSETESGWDTIESVKVPTSLAISHGYFIKQTAEFLTIAADYDPGTKHFNRFIHIPLVNIKKKRKIKL